ncbi:MAG: hypothetical protein OEY09_07475 [Gammaproteobacteria bacterium]|nr:hypothetical protein [Gammaproteobacteria bacterium]
MPGIAGPFKTTRGDHLRRTGVRAGIVAPKNELEIFCSLCVGCVYFRDENRTLYFVDSPDLSISDIIIQVFEGLNQTPSIRQLYMDEHNLFSAARCVQISSVQGKALFPAFTLSGVHITRSLAD